MAFTEAVEETTTAANLDPALADRYQFWTHFDAKTLTVQDDADVAQPEDGEWHLRNDSPTNLTLAEDTAVTINPPSGGTLVIPPNGTGTLKRVDVDLYDLIGQTVAAVPDASTKAEFDALCTDGDFAFQSDISSESLTFSATIKKVLVYLGVLPFTPDTLFANGEQGALYDPSVLSTMYQGVTGSTPAAVDQPVGLLLDSRYSGPGPELIDLSAATVTNTGTANGTFDTGTNTFSCDGAGASGQARLDVAVGGSASKFYIFEGVYTGDFALLSSTGTFVVTDNRPNPTTGTFSIVTKGSSTVRLATFDATIDGSIVIETASLREIMGTHATQATAASRPILRQTGAIYRIDHDGVDDYLRTVFPDLGSDVTIARSIPGSGTSILTGQTVGAGNFDDSTDSCALIIIDRALTAGETANLTTWLDEKAGI